MTTIINKYKICDRCGSKDTEIPFFILKKMIYVYPLRIEMEDLIKGDLCKKCSKEFLKWYENKKIDYSH